MVLGVRVFHCWLYTYRNATRNASNRTLADATPTLQLSAELCRGQTPQGTILLWILTNKNAVLLVYVVWRAKRSVEIKVVGVSSTRKQLYFTRAIRSHGFSWVVSRLRPTTVAATAMRKNMLGTGSCWRTSRGNSHCVITIRAEPTCSLRWIAMKDLAALEPEAVTL